jgi:hypothetical protein
MTYAPKIVLQLPLPNRDLVGPFVKVCLCDGVILTAIVGEDVSKMDDFIDELVVGDGGRTEAASSTTPFIPTRLSSK